VGAVGREDVDAAGSRREDVAAFVDLQPVRAPTPPADPRRCVREDPGGAERAVVLHRECHPEGALPVGVRHVERPLVGREGETVRRRELAGRERRRGVARHAVDARPRELARRVVERPRQAERRVGEPHLAVRADDDVVRTVEPLPVVPVRDHALRAVALEAGHAAVAVLAEDEPPRAVEREAVRARLAAGEGCGAPVPRALQMDPHRLALAPGEDDVGGDVREEERPRRKPDGPLDPRPALDDGLEAGVARDERVEPRVDQLDVAGERRRAGEERDDERTENRPRPPHGRSPSTPRRMR
jgi:hypothetical protein